MAQSVLQDWVVELTMMQQSVLLTGIRGPDGLRKDHVAKLILRWYRRCILRIAFGGIIISDPCDKRGGSFTGPSVPDANNDPQWEGRMDDVVTEYMHYTDEIPHHFQLHVLHASEIMGYKHPDRRIQEWWLKTYYRLCNDMHVRPEAEADMDYRLGDSERQWREMEAGVTANGPT